MSEGRLLIGTVGYPVGRKQVHGSVDLVEIVESRQLPPSRSTARKWRRAAPGTVRFAAQLSRFLFDPLPPDSPAPAGGASERYGDFRPTEENRALWERCREFADGLDAEALVLITPAEVTPASPALERMLELLGTVERGGIPLVWEPHGPWEHERAAGIAEQHGLVLAVDPLRDAPPPGELAYLRLGPFAAMGSRVGVYDLERIAAAAAGFERAICVFETPRALDDARNLKRLPV
jgi:uncharacterized protein YecE (DUF72 family)